MERDENNSPRAPLFQTVLRFLAVDGDSGEIAVARYVIQKYGSRLTAPLAARVELRRRIGEVLGFDVRARQIQMPEPRVDNLVRRVERFQRFLRLPPGELNFAFQQFRVCLGLRLGSRG